MSDKNSGRNCRVGFTMLELLIVIIVIAVMASLVLPRFSGRQEKARVTEAVAVLGTMRRGEMAYFNDESAYLSVGAADEGWDKLGMGNPHLNPNRYWDYEVDLDNNWVVARRRSSSGGPPIDPARAYLGNSTSRLWLGIEDRQWGGDDVYAPGGPYAPNS